MKNIYTYLSLTVLSLSLVACGGGGSTETPVAPPAAPANFNATAGNASANVSWTQVSGTTYTLYYATAANISPSNCSTTPSCVKIDNADPRTISGLTNGTAYYFVATASKDGQTSDPTATRTVTPVAPAVAAPTGFAVTPGNGGVSLNWDVQPSTTYTVYYATSNTLTPANCATLTGCVTRTNVTPGQIAGLTNGTLYYFIITATQNGTTSPASTPVSATPIPAAVPAPTGVVATAGNAQASVSWNAVAGNTYNLYYASDASLTPTNCATLTGCTKLSGVTTPRVVTGLTNGTTYYFVVTANNSGIESPASSVVNAKPAAPLVVAAPTGLSATAGNAQAVISWTQAANTSYTMYLSESSTVSPSNYSSQAGGRMIANVTSPYTVPSLSNGKIYYFVLTATQQTTTSAPSTAVSAMPVAPVVNTWAAVTSSGYTAGSAEIYGFAYGNGTYVAVGGANKLLRSTNGSSWVAVTAPVTAKLPNPIYKSVSFVNGVFLAVAYEATTSQGLLIQTSMDGQSWTTRLAVDSNDMVNFPSQLYPEDYSPRVVYSSGKYVLACKNGFVVSPDLNLWSFQSRPSSISYDNLNWSMSIVNNQFVMPTLQGLAVSSDLLLWSRYTVSAPNLAAPLDSQLYSLNTTEFSYGNSVYVIGLRSATQSASNAVVQVPDFYVSDVNSLTNFTGVFVTGVSDVKSIDFGGGKFMAATNAGIYTSTDGQAWTATNITAVSGAVEVVRYLNGKWYAATNQGIYSTQ